MPKLPDFDMQKIQPLRCQAVGSPPTIHVRSKSNSWHFRLRTRPLTTGEKAMLGALSHLAGRIAGIKHWAVELTNKHTGETFLFELQKHKGRRNELGVYHLYDDAPVSPYNDRWRDYGFDASKFVYGNVAENVNPNEVYGIANRIIGKHPIYYLLLTDCIAFATALMQKISFCEDVGVTLRELLGLNPHNELPAVARALVRVALGICPQIYALSAIPRSHHDGPGAVRKVFINLVQVNLQAVIGYHAASVLAQGLGWVAVQGVATVKACCRRVLEQVLSCIKRQALSVTQKLNLHGQNTESSVPVTTRYDESPDTDCGCGLLHGNFCSLEDPYSTPFDEPDDMSAYGKFETWGPRVPFLHTLPRSETSGSENSSCFSFPSSEPSSPVTPLDSSRFNPYSTSLGPNDATASFDPFGTCLTLNDATASFDPFGTCLTLNDATASFDPFGPCLTLNDGKASFDPFGTCLTLNDGKASFDPFGTCLTLNDATRSFDPFGSSIIPNDSMTSFDPFATCSPIPNDAKTCFDPFATSLLNKSR